MSDRPSRRHRVVDDDPVLEFPSEAEPFDHLTRRLRSAPAERSPALVPQEPGPARARTPLVWPAEPEPEAEGKSEPARSHVALVLDESSGEGGRTHRLKDLGAAAFAFATRAARWMARPVQLAVVIGVLAGVAAVTVAYARIASETESLPAVADDGVAVPMGSATITSNPTGGAVTIDDEPRGATPLTVSLPPGVHQLELLVDGERSSLPLVIADATTASAHVELARVVPPVAARAGAAIPAPRRPAPAPGWVSIDIPVDLQVLRNGRVLGSTGGDPIRLPAGRHQLELVSDELEYRAVVSVTVPAAGTARPAVSLPRGQVAISAWPWARVFIDGEDVGTTPIGSLSLPIGTHEVVWRHPQLGERRQAIVVKARTTARAGVDYRR